MQTHVGVGTCMYTCIHAYITTQTTHADFQVLAQLERMTHQQSADVWSKDMWSTQDSSSPPPSGGHDVAPFSSAGGNTLGE
jgi:hypothetical protein